MHRLSFLCVSLTGDSGGPLLIPHRRLRQIELGNPAKDLIVGLVSFGPEICGSERPGVYTSVFAFGDWIVKKTGKRSLRKVKTPMFSIQRT